MTNDKKNTFLFANKEKRSEFRMKNVRLLESTLLGATEVFSSEPTTPKTDSKSYKLAQKTLESEEEQFLQKKK